MSMERFLSDDLRVRVRVRVRDGGARWVSDGCQTVPDGCQMGIRWVSDGCQETIRALLDRTTGRFP